jgi:hypothetical protein
VDPLRDLRTSVPYLCQRRAEPYWPEASKNVRSSGRTTSSMSALLYRLIFGSILQAVQVVVLITSSVNLPPWTPPIPVLHSSPRRARMRGPFRLSGSIRSVVWTSSTQKYPKLAYAALPSVCSPLVLPSSPFRRSLVLDPRTSLPHRNDFALRRIHRKSTT